MLGCLVCVTLCTGNSGDISHKRSWDVRDRNGGEALKLAATHKGPQAERSFSVTTSVGTSVSSQPTVPKAQPLSLISKEQPLQGRGWVVQLVGGLPGAPKYCGFHPGPGGN